MPPRRDELGPALSRLADALARHPARTLARRAWLRRAAVAVVLRERAEGVELLLAQRAISPGDRWSGHLAFPGGLEAPGDADCRATAARETLEEAGLDLSENARLIGALSQVVTARHGSLAPLVVAPLVFAWVGPAKVELGHELVAAHWIPLDALVRARGRKSRLERALGWFLSGRGEPLASTALWGLTLALVDELVRVVPEPPG